MRTLTKERTDLSGISNDFNAGGLAVLNDQESRLILDGPTEQIANKLQLFQEENKKRALAELAFKQAQIKTKREAEERQIEKESKKYLAKLFINEFIKLNIITREQLKDIVQTVGKENIKILDESLVEKSMPEAKSRIRTAVFFSILIFGGLVSLFFVPTHAIIPVIICQLLPVSLFGTIVIFSLSDYCESYVGIRRSFIKEYGSQHFPVQEVREELGLL